MKALVRKIDRSLEPRNQVEKRIGNLTDGARQDALKLIECDSGLKRRDCINQVGDGLRPQVSSMRPFRNARNVNSPARPGALRQ
jgi:hypothetical protein